MDNKGKNTRSTKATREGSFQFTQKVDYALMLFKSLIHQEDKSMPLPVATIADEYDISFAFLQKVAGELKRAGLIVSTRGKSGGYVLARPAEKITLREVIEVLDGPIALMPCQHPHAEIKKPCPRQGSCAIRKSVASLHDEFVLLLGSKTLAQFIA